MIVKMVNGNIVRFTDCVDALVRPDIHEVGTKTPFSMIFTFKNGRDRTLPLGKGDMIYYLNDNGRTIDKDCRLCCTGLEKIIRYELSDDKVGLKAFFADGQFYHIHSDEMDESEKAEWNRLKNK